MKLIVGLGNPGEEYEKNRHNVGCMFVDYLFQKMNDKNDCVPFKYDKYLLSDVAEVGNGPQATHIILAKPHTFMNRSGDAVKKLLEKYFTNLKSPVSNDLIIVHDDLDIPFGKFKIQPQGPKAHNGLTDIQNKLQTMDFLRIRIGVDNRPAVNRMQGEAYVLQNFTEEENIQLPPLFTEIAIRLTPLL